nr:hypothetical protein [Tanacetum cinerariifolium]
MTRSSTKELFKPFKNLEREFRSSRNLFETPSLDESSSPKFNLFYDLEEDFEEDVARRMTETMEEYMCKTRGDYGSGVTRPKIDAKDHFKLKRQFIKELHDTTFSSSDHEDSNEHIEKVLETIDLFYIPNITQDQIMLRAFPITSKTRSTKTSNGLAAIQAQLNNLGREIKKVNEKVYAAQGSYGLKDLAAYSTLHNDALPQKEKNPGSFSLPCYINNICFKKALADLGASIKRNINDDLEPTIEEGKVVNEPMIDLIKTRCDFINDLDDYPSHCDYDRKIHVNYAYNLKSSCMIGFEHVSTNFLLKFSINIMSRKFYNSIMKDKIDYDGKNVVKIFMNVPVFKRNFYVVTNIAVMKNMDIYHDKDMGDVIIGKQFCKVSCVEARMCDGLITIHNGDNNVTYQMVRSHPRFKHLSNEKYNKIPPPRKVSAQDGLNGILHSYQMRKTFYKGIINLGPEYIRDEKIVEWLTRGHISMHEME